MLDPHQVRNARYMLSLSQHELARRAQVSRTALNQFERGYYRAGPNFCRKLRDFFDAESIYLEAVSKPHAVPPGPPEPPVHEVEQVEKPIMTEQEAPESTEPSSSSPLEILIGVGLSLILGRRIGI